MSSARWRVLNAWWTGFYFLLGALNVIVVMYMSERTWVVFKVVDVVLVLAFVMAQVLWLTGRSDAGPTGAAP